MISVIIPVYNAEKYIDECLYSVFTQENAEFEVIIVNDGSTDRTDEQCAKWLENYKNIKYIVQENQGQGSARNCGIRQASGEWLVFLDADDELMPGALHKLQKAAAEEADIVCYEFFHRRRFGEDERIRLFDGKCWWNGDLLRESTSFLWDKMFRVEFWQNENIILENTYGEDFKAVYLLEALCKKFVFLKEPLMRHYEREDNLSSNPNKVMEITKAIEEMINEFNDRKLFERYKASLFYIICRQYEIYQSPDFCTFEPGQLEIINRELERILSSYFTVCRDWMKILQRTELVLIGYQCQLWYGDNSLFDRITFFPELEKFVMGNWKSSAEYVLYMVDLSQEGRCRRFGTRTNKWQKNRWRELSEEFYYAAHQSGNLVQIFIFEESSSDNQELYQLLMNQDEVCSMPKDVPVLEMLISKNISLKKMTQENLPRYKKISITENFWNKGEQYRLQFNENILNAWLTIKNQNKNFEDFFVEREYTNIAIYGMGYLGERLLEELRNSKIQVNYGIDREIVKRENFPMYTMKDELPQVDVIIVTVVHLFFDIRYELNKKTNIPVISLEEILEYLLFAKEEK